MWSLDRALDTALGLSAIGWAVAGVAAGHLPLAVRCTIALVNVVVGCLLLARSVAARPPGPLDLAFAIPSLVLGGLPYASLPTEWPLPILVAFVGAAIFTLLSLLSLGRSFSIFPARRALVVRGPYALVRHPIYLGELAMLVTACATRGPLWALGGFLAMILLLIPRIEREERALANDVGHAGYASRVRFRLFPGIY